MLLSLLVMSLLVLLLVVVDVVVDVMVAGVACCLLRIARCLLHAVVDVNVVLVSVECVDVLLDSCDSVFVCSLASVSVVVCASFCLCLFICVCLFVCVCSFYARLFVSLFVRELVCLFGAWFYVHAC